MSADEAEDVQEVEAVVEDEIEDDDDDPDEDDASEPVAEAQVAARGFDGDDDDLSVMEDNTENADDEDEMTLKSLATEDDLASTATPKDSKSSPANTPGSSKRSHSRRNSIGESSAKKGRSPSVAGLTIPFRTVKKAMKLDPDIPIVQNEAAIMATVAAELFLKKLAKESHRNAKNRGRNTIRYEDVAEARTKSSSLAFLETLLP
jgi:histone H3/H4